MENKELIELLQKYPENTDVTIFGIAYGSMGCFEYEYFDNVEISFDKKCNELMLEGSNQIKIND